MCQLLKLCFSLFSDSSAHLLCIPDVLRGNIVTEDSTFTALQTILFSPFPSEDPSS